MDTDGQYFLHWVYDDMSITFEIIANTTGYVGLGLSPKGSMKNADIIMGCVDDKGLTLQVCD